MSHQNKLWTSQISSGDTAVNGARFMIAKQLLYCTCTNLPYPVEVGWICLNAAKMKKGKELMTRGQMFNISSSTDLFFLGSGWLDVTDVSFDDFWLLKCQSLLVRFMRRLMDMNFAKLARDQWPLRAFQVWTVKRICQHLDTRYLFIEDWIILLGLTWFVGDEIRQSSKDTKRRKRSWNLALTSRTPNVHGFVVFHHGRKLPRESNCKAFHLATRANTMYRFNARSLGSSHKTHDLASWIPCTFYMIVAYCCILFFG